MKELISVFLFLLKELLLTLTSHLTEMCVTMMLLVSEIERKHLTGNNRYSFFFRLSMWGDGLTLSAFILLKIYTWLNRIRLFRIAGEMKIGLPEMTSPKLGFSLVLKGLGIFNNC